MKPCLIIFLFISCQLSGQLKENFENSEFSSWKESPLGRWSISSEKPISGSYSLHHIFDNTISDHDRISLQHPPLILDSAATSWKFKIRHEYDPSSYNNWAVSLASDKDALEMHPKGNINAYFIGVNYTGSDDYIKLWKSAGNSISELITTSFNWQSEIGTDKSAEIEVIREKNGIWKIWINIVDNLSEKIFIGETSDSTGLKISNYFGVYYKYSSAQDRKLWFDDLEINGLFIRDTLPPKLTYIDAFDSKRLVLHFNENIVVSDLTELNIAASTVFKYDSLTVSEKSLHIWLNQAISNETKITVEIKNLTDIYGNLNQYDSASFVYYQPRFNDVIVTEIMADPSPAVLLPEAEYIEILNRSKYTLNLEGWQICVGNSCVSLGLSILHSNSYLVLCNNNSLELFADLPAVMGIEKFPQLSNTGQIITLKDKIGNIIFSIQYSDKWYQDNSKSDGGWSLEIVDPDNPCSGVDNWKASLDIKGGTPGYPNSVLFSNPDYYRPELLKCVIINDTSIYLHFNEIVTGEYLYDTETFFVDNGLGNPYLIVQGNNLMNSVLLCYKKHFKENTLYTLLINNNITDCAGNLIEKKAGYSFGKPSQCNSRDLVINEILFDPYLTGGDFIEIYNRSDKTIDLNGFSVALKNAYTGNLSSRSVIVPHPYTIEPDNYLVLSKSVQLVTSYYQWHSLNSFLETGKFPNLPNESGVIVLIDAENNIIDEVPYSGKMHSKLAVHTKGISLERINYNLPSYQPENWYSASADAGYATPGYINSQYKDDNVSDFLIKVEPEVFSPDGDGYKDVISISYTMQDVGFIASITVFDPGGRPIKKIARNAILGTSGEFTWDGKTDDGRVAPVGPYLILTEIFNLSGTVKRFKNGCIIAEKIF